MPTTYSPFLMGIIYLVLALIQLGLIFLLYRAKTILVKGERFFLAVLANTGLVILLFTGGLSLAASLVYLVCRSPKDDFGMYISLVWFLFLIFYLVSSTYNILVKKSDAITSKK